ncbi:MAG: hypothetical protein EXS51_01620 [Candidatus Taylorbacteria bacterium]|nr:hypothetical protein [Candidatus Taylorbacteria bacterium]
MTINQKTKPQKVKRKRSYPKYPDWLDRAEREGRLIPNGVGGGYRAPTYLDGEIDWERTGLV